MLWAFSYFTIKFQQVRFFECFKAEVIKAKITVVNNGTVQQFGIRLDHFPNIICQ